MGKRQLTLIEKFKKIALEATAEELRLMSLLADFRRDGLMGEIRTVSDPRKKAEDRPKGAKKKSPDFTQSQISTFEEIGQLGNAGGEATGGR